MKCYRIRVNQEVFDIHVQQITSEIPSVTRPVLAVKPARAPSAEAEPVPSSGPENPRSNQKELQP